MALAVELRNEEWFADEEIFNQTMQLFEAHNIINIILDIARRRYFLYMRLTTKTAFVRYVGANTESDYSRLDDWIERIKVWKKEGIENFYFFVHQNIEKAPSLLSAYFIVKLNKECRTDLTIPKLAGEHSSVF